MSDPIRDAADVLLQAAADFRNAVGLPVMRVTPEGVLLAVVEREADKLRALRAEVSGARAARLEEAGYEPGPTPQMAALHGRVPASGTPPGPPGSPDRCACGAVSLWRNHAPDASAFDPLTRIWHRRKGCVAPAAGEPGEGEGTGTT